VYMLRMCASTCAGASALTSRPWHLDLRLLLLLLERVRGKRAV
jgi:hypothetical protein